MSKNKINIRRLRDLHEKATAGPWEATLCEWGCDCYPCPEDCTESPDVCEYGRVLEAAFIYEIKTVEYGDYCDMNDADAEFIAAMRNALPALLDEIERLKADYDRINDFEKSQCAKLLAKIGHLESERKVETAHVISSDDKSYHFCGSCEREVFKSNVFCHICGKKLAWEDRRTKKG